MNNNDFGLSHLWAQGDLVTRGVFILLLAMSLASWMVIIIKALDLRRYLRQARQIESFWHAADFADGLNKLGTDPANPFRALALEGREAAAHHNAQPQLHDSLDASEWLTRTLRNFLLELCTANSGLNCASIPRKSHISRYVSSVFRTNSSKMITFT